MKSKKNVQKIKIKLPKELSYKYNHAQVEKIASDCYDIGYTSGYEQAKKDFMKKQEFLFKDEYISDYR